MSLFRIAILYLFVFLCQSTLAQVVSEEKSSSKNKFIGLGIGMAFPKTDLAPSYQKPSFNTAASFHFNKNKRLNISLWLNVGEVVSENREVIFLDQSEFQINDYASTSYQSLHAEPTLHIFKKEKWGLYIAQGFGFFRYETYDENNQKLADQLNSRAPGETVSNFTVILPSSLGGYYFLPNKFGIHGRVSIWNTQTDYLDNISSFGNPDNNDNIINLQLSIIKQF
ncbi:hypothetical protein [Marivirga lumbricoides]